MTLIAQTAHRPYPVPSSPWIMRQTWSDLAFLHWSVPAEQMRKLIPATMELDTFEGKAWIGVVPFQMSDVSLRGMPAFPAISYFPELNVRTYVTMNGKPGVYFFSLDAGNPIAVLLGRHWFRLPYYNAEMSLTQSQDTITYRSRRTHRGAASVEFSGSYRPISAPYEAGRSSLDYWLTERYCLYTTRRDGRLLRGEIHHRRWTLQRGEAELRVNTMTTPLGITLTGEPLVHYVQKIKMLGWLHERIPS